METKKKSQSNIMHRHNTNNNVFALNCLSEDNRILCLATFALPESSSAWAQQQFL